jgi:mannose-1-phosphate guanylyltransferase
LAKKGVNEVIFAVNYLAEAFVRHYGKSTHSMKVSYCHESRPLGTGGCVKNAENIIGYNAPFLVLNGDILSKLDYNKLEAQHVKNGGTATIALHRVRDSSRYGVAELAERDRIERFVEKPPRAKASSNLINAGVYALSPEIFKRIPSGRRVSIEREVFPTLARDGELFGYRYEGQWIDIGEPSDFMKGNRLILDSEFPNSHFAESADVHEGARVTDPVTVGERTRIGDGSEIGPHVSLSDNVDVGDDVHIKNSVVFPGAVISDSSSVEGAIVGEEAFIGKQAKIGARCLIGDHVVVSDGVKLSEGVTVCPYKEVTESVRIAKRLM